MEDSHSVEFSRLTRDTISDALARNSSASVIGLAARRCEYITCAFNMRFYLNIWNAYHIEAYESTYLAAASSNGHKIVRSKRAMSMYLRE